MNLTKKHLIITGLIILILLSLLFIIGETSFKITPNQITQYIPPAETQLAAVADFDPNLVAHYTFDEGSGTTAGDSSGHGNNGTLINGPTWVSGTDAKVGSGATKFSGTDQYVKILTPSFSLSPSTEDLTISVWVLFDATTTNTYIYQDRGGGTDVSDAVSFYISTKANLRFETNDGTNISAVASPNNSLVTGKWKYASGRFQL